MKNQKGITLVALVITIVVLLILAGVTISMVLGPNGVLTNSQKAKDNSAQGTANDALATALSSLSTDYYAGDGANQSNTANMLATVTAEKLEELAPGYKFKTSATTDNTRKVQMSKDGYVFDAVVSDTLTIRSFSRNTTATSFNTSESNVSL